MNIKQLPFAASISEKHLINVCINDTFMCLRKYPAVSELVNVKPRDSDLYFIFVATHICLKTNLSFLTGPKILTFHWSNIYKGPNLIS